MINTILVLFGSLFATLFVGVPIGLCMLIATFCTLVMFEPNTNLMVLTQRMFVGSDNYVFMAVPFFLLAGELMLKGGISSRLVKFCKVVFWRIPANLANVTTISSAFFGAISGSNPATVSAIGGMMVPAMLEDGYPKTSAAAIAAASGTLGVIIPPSIPMVIYGMTASVSVPKLFLGGIVPGLMLAVLLCLTNIMLCRKSAKPPYELKKQMDEDGVTFIATFKDAVWALMMPAIILGGIYGGFFTPTEASVISVVYSIFVGRYIYKELTWKDIPELMYKAGLNTAMILIIISACSPFAWLMTSKGIPEAISTMILEATQSKFLILLSINIVLLFLGCFLDTGVIILLVTPIFLTIASSVGVSPLSLGLIMVINTSVGMITPPMAVNLYIAARISGCSIEEIAKSIIPYLIVEVAFILILSNFSGLLDFLPNLIG